jgi:hypothetical protein
MLQRLPAARAPHRAIPLNSMVLMHHLMGEAQFGAYNRSFGAPLWQTALTCLPGSEDHARKHENSGAGSPVGPE